ncbi:MAG: GNAT family N-acetyltransferase [Bdellovibrionales bacterium]
MKALIETDRIILRRWKDEDRASFARMNGDPMVMEYLPRPLDEKASNHLVDKFEAHFDAHGFGLYALERKEDGAFMGFTGLNTVEFTAHFTSPKNPVVEIAWRLDYEYWGKGYGSEAAKAVLDYGHSVLKLKEVYAFTVHDNTRSIGMMEKIGMHRVESGDFYYPTLPKNHPLGHFVLYKSEKP